MLASPNWRDEIVTAAKEWPRPFRARLQDGRWQLKGASIAIEHEFAQCAERIGRELKFLLVDGDPVTHLLSRLRAHGSGVRTSHLPKTQQMGSTRITSDDVRVSIYQLGSALVT